MAEQVEISSFDLRYEGCRMKSKTAERILLSSILENGIRDPLQGVDTTAGRILLDGFKRYRCAKKLGINIVPYKSLGDDESFGIIEILKISNAKSLTILEQAKLIDELKTIHKLSNMDIAGLLEKSKSWVSVRIGIIKEMSEFVSGSILSGDFPAYSYMYTLRQFIRINRVKKKEIDEFVKSLSGKSLSIRDIDILANGYFMGSGEFRDQIKKGNIAWGLSSLREAFNDTGECSQFERCMLKDFELTQKYMQRVTCKSQDKRLGTSDFFAQANILSGGIISQLKTFTKAIRDFYDRSGKA